MSDPISSTVDVDSWVESTAYNPTEHRVRRVMRIILFAVGESPLLKSRMVIKGGVLLALQYGTGRHTRDVDFSTIELAQQVNTDELLGELGHALKASARGVDPEILCKIQSHRMLPPHKEASFPTLRIKIGYALQGDKQYQRMLQGGSSSKTVIIDLSFNERTCTTSRIALDEHREIVAYSLFDQIAEKYRALIQQTPGRRNRVRRQDIYDIFRVLEDGYLATSDDKERLMAAMTQKFADRDVSLARETIDDPEIYKRSKKEYDLLQDEIEGELPDFDLVFRVARDYYRSLPWRGPE